MLILQPGTQWGVILVVRLPCHETELREGFHVDDEGIARGVQCRAPGPGGQTCNKTYDLQMWGWEEGQEYLTRPTTLR
jgi:hypothetical protein